MFYGAPGGSRQACAPGGTSPRPCSLYLMAKSGEIAGVLQPSSSRNGGGSQQCLFLMKLQNIPRNLPVQRQRQDRGSTVYQPQKYMFGRIADRRLVRDPMVPSPSGIQEDVPREMADAPAMLHTTGLLWDTTLSTIPDHQPSVCHCSRRAAVRQSFRGKVPRLGCAHAGLFFSARAAASSGAQGTKATEGRLVHGLRSSPDGTQLCLSESTCVELLFEHLHQSSPSFIASSTRTHLPVMFRDDEVFASGIRR